MNSLWASGKGKVIIIISSILLVSALIIGLLTLILSSFLLGFIAYFLLILCLLRLVGKFVMYPGASFYTRSSVELQLSRDLSGQMVKCFNALYALACCIVEGKKMEYDYRINFQNAILRHVKGVIGMLSMFEDNLSKRKRNLLKNYRLLIEIIQLNEMNERLSIAELMIKPKRISSISEEGREFYDKKFTQISQIVKQTSEILNSFVPPQGTLQQLKHRLFEENLFQLRFGYYYYWQQQFNYELYSISTSNNDRIESAIIHSLKQDEGMQGIKKTVLFCNPNGVFIQLFANHEYVINYLKMGYEVILWNYRGYGESTGSPGVCKAQEDVYSVYRFYREKNYDISIVHGYSIGGVAAIALLQTINKNLAKNPTDKIEGLIIDRSFSSISEMAKILGKVANIITRAIFFEDNIDISLGYEQIICKKMIIWDCIDEIIPEIASVKGAILQRRKQKIEKHQDKKLRKDELNQEVTLPHHSIDLSSLLFKFEETIKMMLLRRRRTQAHEKSSNFNSEEQRETSMSTASGLDDNNFEPLIQALALIDGGGVQLMRDVNDLEATLENNPQHFHHLCESFILGLIMYGSYFPLKPQAHDRKVIRTQTLQKIENILNKISLRSLNNKDKENIDAIYSSNDSSAQQINKNIDYIMRKAVVLMQALSEEEEQRYGSLLPTGNGHNNSLSQAELRVLNNFIKSTQLSTQQRLS